MAAYNKFNSFAKAVLDGEHDFSSDTFKVMLTNTAPVLTNSVRADLTEIAAGNGYTAGGAATTISISMSGGVAKVVGSNVVFTATGVVGPFQYAVLYNDTPTSPADPLVGWWDYGAPITMENTETMTIAFDATKGILTLA